MKAEAIDIIRKDFGIRFAQVLQKPTPPNSSKLMLR